MTNSFIVKTGTGVIGFSPVKALIRAAGITSWQDQELLGLKLVQPYHQACVALRERENLTDAAQAHERIRFFLKERLSRNFRDLHTALFRNIGPCTVDVVGGEKLDAGSRAFFEAFPTGTSDLTVRIFPNTDSGDAIGHLSDERERDLEELCATRRPLERNEIEHLEEAAVTYLSVGDNWTAERLLEVALRQAPDARLWAKLGLAHTMRGNTLQAEFCYLRAREIGSRVTTASADYGLAMLYARHHPPHLRSLETTAHYLEQGYTALNRPGGEEIEDMEFHKVFNRNGYALVEYRRGHVQKAVDMLENGISKLSDDSEKNRMHQSVLIYNLAQCHRRSGKLKKAIETYIRLLDVDGRMPEYHMELAHCFLDTGDHQKALEHLLTASVLGPSIQEVHSLLGFTYLQMGEIEKSIAAYREAFEIDPEDFDSRYDYAYALADSGQSERALALLEPVDLTPLSPAQQTAALTLTAEQHATSGDLAAARTALELVLKLTPDSTDARANLELVMAADT